MTVFRLLIRNLQYYWQKNLLLALGIAVSAAVLTGALIVGDSVEYSLKKIVDDRLGNITQVVKSGDRYFTISLAGKTGKLLGAKSSAVLLSEGIAVSGGGQIRLNNVKVIGIDSTFDSIAGTGNLYGDLANNEIIVSKNLASRLNVKENDEILLRIRKESLIPMNAPFVSDRENTVAMRFKIRAIAGREQLGSFNLENSQTAPFNIFISLDLLNSIMKLENKANAILIAADKDFTSKDILSSISAEWNLADASLIIENFSDKGYYQVSSERVFIEDRTAEILKRPGTLLYPILTYFVNSFSFSGNETPYSFVSTLPDTLLDPDEIMISQWLADDLEATIGDTLMLKYFIVGPLRQLEEKESKFIVSSVEKMKNSLFDPDLMPHLPGLSDAGNCRDWETGVPVDLEKIRDKDEKYWDDWKGTPKAFVSLSKAKELWSNRFGSYTAFRYESDNTNARELENMILDELQPSELGFNAENIRDKAKSAAENGVDFGQLFGGLSFFLLASGILLTILLFLLNLEFRKEQITTMSSLGIPQRYILRMIFLEGMIITFLGACLGLVLAIFYNRAIFAGLNGIWEDIVRTNMLVVKIKSMTLIEGFLISILVSAFALIIPLNRFLNKNIRKATKKTVGARSVNKIYIMVSIVSAAIAIGIIGTQLVRNEFENAALFFIAGTLLLVSGISYFRFYLLRIRQRSFKNFSPALLSLKNAFRNPSRSMTIVILFALAAFLVISTGSNRKDLFVNSGDPTSGTGGFLFYAESTVPVLQDLNSKSIRYEYGLSEGYSFVQFRKAEGDDASCLNLNRIQNPEIIATQPEKLAGKFSFVTHTPYLLEEDPWQTLSEDLPGDLIPAIADETVIKWGLGLKVGDSLLYTDAQGNEMKLLLVGGLAPSVFQGKVIISGENFLKHFPQNSGTNVFLVDGNPADSAMIRNEIQNGLRDLGIETEFTARRLVEFYSVTNTYLSIFMIMGAIALLLGTIGLGIVLFRSILERRNELAIIRAVGIRKTLVRKIVNREYLFLLLTGTIIGFVTAFVASMPSFLSPNTGVSVLSVVIILALLILNGWFWTFLITRRALKITSLYESLRNE